MKKRFIIFTVLSVVSAVFTLIFATSLCELAGINTGFADEVGDINIDGSDFTPIFKMGASIMDIFMSSVIPVIFAIGYFIAVSLLNLAMFGVFGLFAFRNSETGMEELGLVRRLFAVFSVGAAAVVLVMSICSAAFLGANGVCFLGLLFCWQYPLFAWLFYLRRLR